MDWIKILKIIGPAIMAVVPGGLAFAPLVIAGIELAEETQKAGAEKKEIAKDAVKLGAEAANAVAKKSGIDTEVINPNAAVQVADDTIDAVVGATNLVSKALDATKKTN